MIDISFKAMAKIIKVEYASQNLLIERLLSPFKAPFSCFVATLWVSLCWILLLNISYSCQVQMNVCPNDIRSIRFVQLNNGYSAIITARIILACTYRILNMFFICTGLFFVVAKTKQQPHIYAYKTLLMILVAQQH